MCPPTLVHLSLLYLEDLRLQLQPPDPQLSLVFAGFIRSVEIKLLTAGNLVPCQKTSSPLGVNPIQPASSYPQASDQEEICCSSLIFLKDIPSNREFLVDSGASVSIFLGAKGASDNGVCLLTADDV